MLFPYLPLSNLQSLFLTFPVFFWHLSSHPDERVCLPLLPAEANKVLSLSSHFPWGTRGARAQQPQLELEVQANPGKGCTLASPRPVTFLGARRLQAGCGTPPFNPFSHFREGPLLRAHKEQVRPGTTATGTLTVPGLMLVFCNKNDLQKGWVGVRTMTGHPTNRHRAPNYPWPVRYLAIVVATALDSGAQVHAKGGCNSSNHFVSGCTSEAKGLSVSLWESELAGHHQPAGKLIWTPQGFSGRRGATRSCPHLYTLRVTYRSSQHSPWILASSAGASEGHLQPCCSEHRSVFCAGLLHVVFSRKCSIQGPNPTTAPCRGFPDPVPTSLADEGKLSCVTGTASVWGEIKISHFAWNSFSLIKPRLHHKVYSCNAESL